MIRKHLFIALFSSAMFGAVVPRQYVVELSEEPVAERVTRLGARGGVKGSDAQTYRRTLRNRQQTVRSRMDQRQIRVMETTDTVANSLIVEVPDDAAANTLSSIPGVKRVHPVRTFHMTLDRAAVLHRVTDAWNRVGTDRAGAGVKVAIIDSGIETSHPAFQDSSMSAPDSYPRFNAASDAAFANGKVIVARSYVSLLPRSDPDESPRDRVGHGTALAMIVAGVRVEAPMAAISGIAPKAWLGNYKVFGTPGFNDGSTDAAILKALDDAVADGMDIVNLSLGSDLAPRLEDDPEVQAIERATRAGVLVVVSAGNNGPGLNTLASPATAPSAIAVGASTNDRTFAASVEVRGLSSFVAVPGDGPAPGATVSASIADVAGLDETGLACSSLPVSSLAGKVALILRGSCTFETKLTNAQRAGAIAGLIYAAQDSPHAIHMAVGTASIPAEMISHDAGMAIRQGLAADPSLVGTMRFTLGAFSVAGNLLTDFSAAGPSVDAGIKPDVLAVGGDIYTATQTYDQRGDMYDSSGFILVDGTSFSAPLVAGAAALLKSARPGLTADQYRSLLINSAAEARSASGDPVPVQQAGAGLLDVNAAINSTAAAYPVFLSLGAGGADARMSRTLTVTNVGGSAETFAISATARRGSAVPTVAVSTLELAPGASADVAVGWTGTGLTPGPYEGFVTVLGTTSGSIARVPYWYAVASTEPASVTVLQSDASGRRAGTLRDAILFRVTDASGLNVADVRPSAVVVSGGGAVRRVVSYDADVPGMFGIDVVLGPAAGTNVFRIQAGPAAVDVAITGQ